MNKYTHRGWFGFCPIYIGQPYSYCPDIIARRRWLQPLLDLNVWLQEVAISVCRLMDPYWSPMWKIRLTGKISPK